MPRMFGKYGPLDTEEEAFTDGLNTGLKWDADWVPGGPHVIRDRYHLVRDLNWEAYCDATKANNAAWLRGWREGARQSNWDPRTAPRKLHPTRHVQAIPAINWGALR